MEGSASPERAELESSRCAVHPEQPAVAVCERCGDYHCASCHKRVGGRALCERCRGLQGVDYLEETRRRFWGKRDGFVWFAALIMLPSLLASAPTMARHGDVGHVVSTAVWMPLLIAYLVLYRPARLGLVVVSALDLLVDSVRAVLGLPLVPEQISGVTGQSNAVVTFVFGAGLVGLLISLGAYQSPRNKLAFKIAIDDRELQRVYDRYLSNPLAVRSAVYGALAAFIPLASVITLVMAIRALRRADASTWPPRSGRLPARVGLAFSVLGLLGWGMLVLRALLAARH